MIDRPWPTYNSSDALYKKGGGGFFVAENMNKLLCLPD